MSGNAGGSKLFVGNLAWSTDSESLKYSFGQYGDIVDAIVMQDRETGRSRGFGFITFKEQANADAAIEALNGQEVDGREIRVNYANSQTGGGGGQRQGGVAIVEEAAVVVDTIPATAAEATVVTKEVTAAATEATAVASHMEVKVVTAAEVAAKVTGEASKTATMLQAVAAVVVGELQSPLPNVHESKFVLG